jgi:cysteine desulfuration protein SufE
MTNPRLREIVDDFAAVGDKDRLQLLLEFSEELPALPGRYADHRDLLESVPECQSPLFLAVEVGADDSVHLFFDAPREAPTTRGFAGILHAGLDGMPADEVLATPVEFTGELGLQHLVSPLRLRGMAAMLARIQNQVRDKRAGLTVSLPTLVLRQGNGQPSGIWRFRSVPLRFEPAATSGRAPFGRSITGGSVLT